MRWSRKSDLAIHQFIPAFSPGDAIGSEAVALQRTLQEWGATSRIYAGHIHYACEGRAEYFESYRPSSGDTILFHFAISSPLSSFVAGLPVRKVLLYHNTTPARFFRGYNPELATLLERSREELASLREGCALALADSEYNRRDLEALGFAPTAVLAVLLDLKRFDDPDPRDPSALEGSGPRFLSVSRIVPSKRIEDIIRIFYYFSRCISSEAKLFIVGSGDTGGSYLEQLKRFISALRLDKMVFTDSVSDTKLRTLFHRADALISMSEHEGFCVPLVEAMYFDVPIVAFNTGAVSDTLNGSGVLVNWKDPAEIAELIHLIASKPDLKARLLKGQRARLEFFRPERVKALLRGYLESAGIVFPHVLDKR